MNKSMFFKGIINFGQKFFKNYVGILTLSAIIVFLFFFFCNLVLDALSSFPKDFQFDVSKFPGKIYKYSQFDVSVFKIEDKKHNTVFTKEAILIYGIDPLVIPGKGNYKRSMGLHIFQPCGENKFCYVYKPIPNKRNSSFWKYCLENGIVTFYYNISEHKTCRVINEISMSLLLIPMVFGLLNGNIRRKPKIRS